MHAQVGNHNIYNLMDYCPGTTATLGEWQDSMKPDANGNLPRMDRLRHEHVATEATAISAAGSASDADADLPLGERQRWCGVDDAMMAWLAVADVKAALHVATPKGTEQNNLDYKKGGADDLTSLYKAIANKYRLWIYNGQEDGCIPYNAMESFTSGLGFPVTSEWHPWSGGAEAGGSRVAAGYATQYGGTSKDLAFVTVSMLVQPVHSLPAPPAPLHTTLAFACSVFIR
jgi:hypothetical protein